MKSCVAGDAAILSLMSVRASVPLKWLVSACMITVVSSLNPVVAYSSADDNATQGSADKTPPDFSTMRLVGAMKIGRSAVVVFENAKGEQTSYPVGRTFSDGSKITTVNDRSIIVRKADGSAVEYFVAPGDTGKPGAVSVGRPVIDSPPPAYIPADSSDPDSNRSRRKRIKVRNSEQEE